MALTHSADHGIDAGNLPTYLAIPWSMYCRETNPHALLLGIIGISELVVRWAAALVLAEVANAGRHRLDEELLEEIRPHIGHPTLGQWLGILDALAKRLPQAPCLGDGIAMLCESVRSEVSGVRLGDASQARDASLVVLRNDVFHGFGVSRDCATTIVLANQPRVVKLMRQVAASIDGVSLIAAHGARTFLLRGPEPQELDAPAYLPGDAKGPYLAGEGWCMPLLPLAEYAPITSIAANGAVRTLAPEPAPQVYRRLSSTAIAFTPIGSTEFVSESPDVTRFQEFFALDVGTRCPGTESFLDEAKAVRPHLVERAEPLKTVKAWLKGRNSRDAGISRLCWISGRPGVGKSMLVANLAADASNADRSAQGVFLFAFRSGDERNSRSAFMFALEEQLTRWLPVAGPPATKRCPDGEDIFRRLHNLIGTIARIGPQSNNRNAPRFLVFIDGLDEVVAFDKQLPELLIQLALPGTLWILAGRPEYGLDDVFSRAGMDVLFPDEGLPGMTETEMRAMVMEGLERARIDVLENDVPKADGGFHNLLVEKILAKAEGLPLYVRLLVEDRPGRGLTLADVEHLPQGWRAYCSRLIEGLGTAKADLSIVLGLLALAAEPLDLDALALILGQRGFQDLATASEWVGTFRDRVTTALRAGRALLDVRLTADGVVGHTLYHPSLREHIVGIPDVTLPGEWSEPPAAEFEGLLADAKGLLRRTAGRWLDFPPGTLRNHVFRHGSQYELDWGGASGVDASARLLSDFAYLYERIRALGPIGIRDIIREQEETLFLLEDGEDVNLGPWSAFLREREHLLARTESGLPCHQVFVQLAVEHGDESPITRAAESWLARVQPEWVFLRQVWRPQSARPSACLRTLSGHADRVDGVRILGNGNLASWSGDGTVRLWKLATGEPLVALWQAHPGSVHGLAELPGDRFFTWREGEAPRVWDATSGQSLGSLPDFGPDGAVLRGATELPDGSIAWWNSEGEIRILECTGLGASGPIGETEGGGQAMGSPVAGALALSSGDLLVWLEDNRIVRCDPGKARGPLVFGTPPPGDPPGTEPGGAGTALLIESAGQERRERPADSMIVSGVETLAPPEAPGSDWWFEDDEDQVDERPPAGLTPDEPPLVGALHSDIVLGALEVPGGPVLTWSADRTLRLWKAETGAHVRILELQRDDPSVPAGMVLGAALLTQSEVVIWDSNGQIRLMDVETGAPVSTPLVERDGPVTAACLWGRRFISGTGSGRIRIWDLDSPDRPLFRGHHGRITDLAVVPGGFVVSGSRDSTLAVWSARLGALLAFLRGHEHGVLGVAPSREGTLVSWSEDGEFREWDLRPLADSAAGSPLDENEPEHRETLTLASAAQWAYDDAALLQPHLLALAAAQPPPPFMIAPDVTGLVIVPAGTCMRLERPDGVIAAAWQCESTPIFGRILPDGSLAVALASGEVVFLRPFLGNRPISLGDL